MHAPIDIKTWGNIYFVLAYPYSYFFLFDFHEAKFSVSGYKSSAEKSYLFPPYK